MPRDRRWLAWLLALSLTANGFLGAFLLTSEWLRDREGGVVGCISQGALPDFPAEFRASFLDALERDRADLAKRAEALLAARLQLLAALADPSDEVAIGAARQALTDGAAGVQTVVVDALVGTARRYPGVSGSVAFDVSAQREALRRCFDETMAE